MNTEEIISYKRKKKREPGGKLTELIRGGGGVLGLIAVMVARVNFLGSLAPLGISWYAANINTPCSDIVLAGAVAGTFLMGGHAGKWEHIAALGLLCLLKKTVDTPKWNKTTFVSIVSAGCIVFSGLLFALFSGIFYYNMLTSLLEGLIVWGMGPVFSKSAGVIDTGWQIKGEEQSISIAILAGAVVAGLQGLSFFGIKPANVLSMYIILFTAYKGGIGISGATGAALGIIAGMSQGDAPALTGVYAFMGLVSGVMNIFGKMGVVLSAAFANSLFTGYYNSSTIVLVNLVEIAAAGVIFFFTPDKTLNFFEKFSMKTPVYDAAGGYVMRMKGTAGEALAGIKNAATAISEVFMPPDRKDGTSPKKLVRQRLIARVCEGCSLNKYCWTRNVSGSNMMMDKVIRSLFEEKYDEMGGHITGRCVRGDTLCETAKELYGIQKRENMIEKRVDFFAKSFASGWGDFVEIINEKEKKLLSIKSDFGIYESELCRYLTVNGIKNPEISIIINDAGRFEIMMKTAKEIHFDIIPAAEKITGRKMTVSDEYPTRSGFVMKLQERLKFDYDVSIITMNKQDSEQTGDSAEWFVTPDGMFCILLCDGMGSGVRAKEDSQKTAELFKTLVLSGFSPESVLKIINSGLISGGKEERCISVDCACINLFTGETEFIKAGAVAGIIKSGGKAILVKQNTIPLGVLPVDKLTGSSMILDGDSYIVMMTDGVTDNTGDRRKGEECAKNLVELMEVSSSKEMAESIMMSAAASGVPKDDMMVAAIRLTLKSNQEVVG